MLTSKSEKLYACRWANRIFLFLHYLQIGLRNIFFSLNSSFMHAYTHTCIYVPTEVHTQRVCVPQDSEERLELLGNAGAGALAPVPPWGTPHSPSGKWGFSTSVPPGASLFQGHLHYMEDRDLTLQTHLAMCISVDARKATLYHELCIC